VRFILVCVPCFRLRSCSCSAIMRKWYQSIWYFSTFHSTNPLIREHASDFKLHVSCYNTFIQDPDPVTYILNVYKYSEYRFPILYRVHISVQILLTRSDYILLKYAIFDFNDARVGYERFWFLYILELLMV